MSERNIRDAEAKKQSAPEPVPMLWNIEKLRPRRVLPVTMANAHGTTDIPFPSKLIVATHGNIPAQEDMEADAGDDTSVQGTLPCSLVFKS